MKHLFLFLPLIWLLILGSCHTRNTEAGKVYFVDPVTGNDLNAGTSPVESWKTLDRINSADLEAGDQVLLTAGQVFTGTIRLKNLPGTASSPILIASYGKGKATIDSGDSLAIQVDSSTFITCKNLILQGSGRLNGNKSDGLLFSHVRFGTVDSVEASGYLYSGIHIAGGSDISITRAYSHDNGFCGIYTESGEPEYGADGSAFKTLKNIYIGFSVAENNPGCPVISDNHSGNGILFGGVVNGMIEYCEAMNNGWDMPRDGNGPVGIWAYMSDSITIQHCYSHHNKTSPHGKDGGGFDFDGGMRHSVMQYNLSAFNEGAGYGIFQYAGATDWSGNVVRYNISFNDGSKNSSAGIFMWCDPAARPMSDFHAYNNTIVTAMGLVVNFEPGNYEGFTFENNIFLMTGAGERFVDGHYTGAVFDNNLYWSAYNNSINLQQPVRPPDIHALQADPQLILPDARALSVIRPDSLQAISFFRLHPASLCRQTGKVIDQNGGYDFWNKPVHEKTGIGAWQGL